jgi:hypothetical protein
MSSDKRRADLVLHARFLPSWSHIEPLRLYLEVCTKARPRFANTEGACIVLQELLENAVKYSLPSCSIELDVFMDLTAGPVEIRVTNQSSPARLAMLTHELRLTRSNSAHAAFATALARLKSLPSGTSMLGLARIATTAALESEITETQVIMSARLE